MNTLTTAAIVAVAVLVSCGVCFFAGRASVKPAIVVERSETTKTQQVVKTVKAKDRVRTVHTVTVVEAPDGGTTTTTSDERDEDKGVVGVTGTTPWSWPTNQAPTAPKTLPTWRLGPLVGVDLATKKLVGGVSIDHSLGGPWSAGVFGLSSGVAGVSLSVAW